MNLVQEKLLRLMQELNEICVSNDIQYYFCGGISLGALRNKGFLPWEDDADVLIKREDFIKLDRVMSEMEFEDRSWVSENSTPYYRNPVARFIDTSTTNVIENWLGTDVPKGVLIEFFVLDPYPEALEDQKEYNTYLWLYTEVLYPQALFARMNMAKGMTNRELYYEYKEMVDREGYDAVRNKILEKMRSYHNDAEKLCVFYSCKAYVHNKEWFREQVYVPFENTKIPVMNGLIHTLILNYDHNWDIVPIPKDRKEHPAIMNAEIPFSLHETEVKEMCADVDYYRLLEENKQDRMKRYFSRIDIEENFSGIRNIYLTNIAQELNKNKWEFSSEKIEEYDKEFEEFFLTQFKFSYSKYELAVPLNDDLIETMVLTLIHSDRIEHAEILNKLYPSSGGFERRKNWIETLYELKIKKYQEDIPTVTELLAELGEYSVLDGQVEIERTRTWLLSKTSKKNDSEIEEYFTRCRHQEDQELRKYVGDLFFNCGATEKARVLYGEVLRKSRNGMILTDLRLRGIELESDSEGTGNA